MSLSLLVTSSILHSIDRIDAFLMSSAQRFVVVFCPILPVLILVLIPIFFSF